MFVYLIANAEEPFNKDLDESPLVFGTALRAIKWFMRDWDQNFMDDNFPEHTLDSLEAEWVSKLENEGIVDFDGGLNIAVKRKVA